MYVHVLLCVLGVGLFVCVSVGQAILSHLSDVKGMSLWPEKFGALGLCHEKTMEAINHAGSLLLKASELQQYVINLFN